MEHKAYALIAILLASVASVALVSTAYAQTTSVTVETDRTSYASGDRVTVSGDVTNIQAGTPILLRVQDPKGSLVRTDQVPVAADGSWNYSFPTGGPLMREAGDYKIIVNYRTATEEATFSFTPEAEWSVFNLTIDDTDYEIRYRISGGTVDDMTADVALAVLAVNITSTSNGTLTIELPRDVMQALSVPGVPSGGSDVDYAVFIDTMAVDTDPDVKTADTRTLTIDFDQGAEDIEIIGTWIVPEFGAIAAIVLAVAIVGIIVATTRYGKFNGLLPRH